MDIAAQSHKKCLEYIFGETAKGNGQPFLDALADDAEWRVIGRTGWSKTYRGKAEILRDLIAPLRRALVHPRKSHAHCMIAEGNLVAVQGQSENMTRAGRKYENTYCWVFAFRAGQVMSIVEYADTELMREVLGEPQPAGLATLRHAGAI
jgi:uncharacterized protein